MDERTTAGTSMNDKEVAPNQYLALWQDLMLE